MISYNSRNKIRKNFLEFNKKFSSVKYPSTREVNEKDGDETTNVYVDDPSLSKGHVEPLQLKQIVPKKDLTVNYGGDKLLNKSIKNNINIDTVIDVCVYKICNKHLNPYLLFSLFRDNNELSFLKVDMNGKNKSELINSVIDTFKQRDDDNEVDMKYKGLFHYRDKHIAFFEYHSKKGSIVRKGSADQNMFWTLTSEIINYKKVLDQDIDRNVTHFFTNHTNFAFLNDDLGMTYECPAVGYFGSYTQSISFVAAIGPVRGNNTDKFGSHYYFGNYDNALGYAKTKLEAENDDSDISTKGAILRAAIFLENVMIPGLSDNKHLKDNWWKTYNSVVAVSDKDKTKVLYVLKNYDQYSGIECYTL